MANPYTNEEELFERMKKEHVTFHPLIWDSVYDYLGDRISAVEMMVAYYHESNIVMPKGDCLKVIAIVDEIGSMIHKIGNASLIEEGDPLFLIKDEVEKIPQYVGDLLQHHISNDCHAIGFIMGDAADTGFANADYQERVLARTSTLISYLEKFMKATSKKIEIDRNE